jgi:prevent-host-death family protein
MEKKVSITRAREKFSDLVEGVQHQGDAYIISRHGRPAAAMVPVEVYERWKRERQAFFDLIRQGQDQANLSAEEAERLAFEAVKEVRSGS